MKYIQKILFLFFIIVVKYSNAQAPDPDFNDKKAFSEAQSYLKSASFVESTDYGLTDLVYQRLNFEVDPAVNYISGSVLSLVKFQDENITRIHFDLSSNMVVDSVSFDSANIDYEHTSDRITLAFPFTIQKNSLHQFDVFYHGAPPQTGFGSFALSKHIKTPILWTLSEPYGARDWWPCKESLKDKIDSIDVFITSPSQYRAASNGKLITDQISGAKRTAHWRHRYPIATYLVAIAVTNYETYSDFLELTDGKKIEVLNYVYPEYLEVAKTKSEEIRSILAFYNSKLITYPFASEKYGHAQFGWGGGMEHQTMSFMSGLDFDLVAHEMAHQWFGDYITLASWHDIWLNEGFATYMTGLVYETLKDGYFWPLWKNQQVKKITSSSTGSVYVEDTTSVSRIFDSRLSYSKGAYLLHMLRWEMGDDSFFKGLKDYLNDPEIANGFASQQKFVKHMETSADTSLTEFFNDWYYGEGYPIFHLSYFPDKENPARNIIRISQHSSDPSVSFFEMHVPVRVWKGGVSNDLRLYNNQQNQEFVISETGIDSIQFDPEKWLCAKVDKVLPVPEVSKPEHIKIIPDYLDKKIRVLISDFTGQESFRIVDMNGKVVINGFLQGNDSQIEITTLKKGIFLVEVQAKNRKKTEKIIVTK